MLTNGWFLSIYSSWKSTEKTFLLSIILDMSVKLTLCSHLLALMLRPSAKLSSLGVVLVFMDDNSLRIILTNLTLVIGCKHCTCYEARFSIQLSNCAKNLKHFDLQSLHCSSWFNKIKDEVENSYLVCMWYHHWCGGVDCQCVVCYKFCRLTPFTSS